MASHESPPAHDLLGVTSEAFEGVREQFRRRTYAGRIYRYLPDDRGALPRGTVLVGDTAVRGFPKIPRTLVLRTGVPRFFEGTDAVTVEEKLNGYNVRVVRVGGDLLAFTRGGLVCPFTTYEVRESLGDELDACFDAHPEAMVCVETIGPENPYTAHDYPGVDSLAHRVFDVRERESGTPWPVEDRRAACERFDLPPVPHLGTFGVEEAVEVLPGIVEELDAEGREGVVLKSPDATRLLKYTTGAANRGDLAYAFSVPFDYGRDFMFRRLLREAFQSVEWGESPEAREVRAHAVGEAILAEMCDTVEAVAGGAEAGERHTVRAPPAVVEALLDHLTNAGVKLAVERDERAGDERVLTFRKNMQSTTDKARLYLGGHVVRE
ncbi:RNA ligase [Halomarina litorea]|uniref:RNA ligase n=1 Tax=Halomarina litorea TaxID=2961595 RepID=UPI0020C56955|nr:RNA ligase [Halomarina sp. BCD28]